MAVARLVAMASGTVRAGMTSPAARLLLPQVQEYEDVWAPSFWTKMAAPGRMFDFVRLANARLDVRCRATASTISEREVVQRGDLENAHSNSRPMNVMSFELAEADVGRVECNGKGCRPVYEDDTALSMAYPVHHQDSWGLFPSHAEVQIKIEPQITGEHLGLNYRSGAMTRSSFEGAMQEVSHDLQHLSEFAVFLWKSLGDVDKAEELYQEALVADPDDTDVLASYANFLWQCDQ